MKCIALALLLLFAPVAYAQNNTADRIGAAVHPLYISLAYTCVPLFNEVSSVCSSLGMSLCLPPLCFVAPFLLAIAGFLKCLTLPVVYGFPVFFSFLGLLGGNPNFFIGGLGDLFGHFFVDLGSTMSLLLVCMPCGAFFTACGDLITIFGNGLSVLVVGDIFTAVQQFAGAAILGIITLLSALNILGWLTIIWIPFSFIAALVLLICTNLVGLGTDILGQIITYCRPAFSKFGKIEALSSS
jgi:hypothetical protein